LSPGISGQRTARNGFWDSPEVHAKTLKTTQVIIYAHEVLNTALPLPEGVMVVADLGEEDSVMAACASAITIQ
jgi:hypothetical protein